MRDYSPAEGHVKKPARRLRFYKVPNGVIDRVAAGGSSAVVLSVFLAAYLAANDFRPAAFLVPTLSRRAGVDPKTFRRLRPDLERAFVFTRRPSGGLVVRLRPDLEEDPYRGGYALIPRNTLAAAVRRLSSKGAAVLVALASWSDGTNEVLWSPEVIHRFVRRAGMKTEGNFRAWFRRLEAEGYVRAADGLRADWFRVIADPAGLPAAACLAADLIDADRKTDARRTGLIGAARRWNGGVIRREWLPVRIGGGHFRRARPYIYNKGHVQVPAHFPNKTKRRTGYSARNGISGKPPPGRPAGDAGGGRAGKATAHAPSPPYRPDGLILYLRKVNGSGNDRLDWESVRRTLASERRRYPTIPNDRMNRAGEYAFRRLLACLARSRSVVRNPGGLFRSLLRAELDGSADLAAELDQAAFR